MRKPFEGILGNTCELRILEFLLPLEGLDFNISELAEEVGVSRPTVQKAIKKFLEYGLVKVTRRRGGTAYYEINVRSPFVQVLNELNNLLIAKMVGPEVMEKVEQHWNRKFIERATTEMKPHPVDGDEGLIPGPLKDLEDEDKFPISVDVATAHLDPCAKGGYGNAA